MSAGTPVEMAEHFEIERFLIREARLLDTRQFVEWAQLFTDDARYWIPLRKVRTISNRPGDRDVSLELSADNEPYILNESMPELRLRIARVNTAKQLWCENPPSRNRHLITNIEASHSEATGEFNVTSNFVVFQARFDEQGTQYFGERHDVLRRVADSLKIAYRKVILDSSVIWSGAVTSFF